MARKIELPTVSPEELSPLVVQLLGIVETLIEENRRNRSETYQKIIIIILDRFFGVKIYVF